MRHQQPHLDNRQAFTLIELLIVISIIGFLMALLLPAVQASRESARRVHCSNNQKQLGLGLLGYCNSKGKLPPGATRDWAGWYSRANCSAQGSGPSWIAHVLPYVGLNEHYDKMNWSTPPGKDPFNEPPNQPNQAIGKVNLALVRCPSDRAERPSANWAPTNYVACVGNATHTTDTAGRKSGCVISSKQGAAFYINSSRYLDSFQDGAQITLLLSECKVGLPDTNRGYSWIYGQYNSAWSFSTRVPPNDPLTSKKEPYTYTYYSSYGARSNHPTGVVVSMADGAVHFVDDSIDIGVWRAMGTIAGAEPITSPF